MFPSFSLVHFPLDSVLYRHPTLFSSLGGGLSGVKKDISTKRNFDEHARYAGRHFPFCLVSRPRVCADTDDRPTTTDPATTQRGRLAKQSQNPIASPNGSEGVNRNDEVISMAKEQNSNEKPKLKRKQYEKELRRLAGRALPPSGVGQSEGLRIIVVFEGRDGAGKGGTIRAITERVSPRVFRVVALPAPSDREKSQMYIQRYMQHFPAAGEIVIFDRSWYNRAGVEYVMGFCTKEQHRRFLEVCPGVEKFIVDSGIQLIKYWLEVSNEEQKRRFEARINDPLRQWKLSPMDLPSRSRWYEYSRARDMMLRPPIRRMCPGTFCARTTRSGRASTASRIS